jgi:uncharacterized protein (DUF1800 family)
MKVIEWRRAMKACVLVLGVACAIPAAAQVVDTDGDGVPDNLESQFGLNPRVKDNDIFSDAGLFVRQQYRDVFQREGDPGGVAYWAGSISSGATVREQLIANFVRSPEFRDSIAPVARLYLAYFDRAPDFSGLTYWTARFQGGTSLAEISEAFAQSGEFVQLYGPKTNAEFVQLIYRNVLERQPDPSGYAYWVGELDSKRRTRGAVMAGFSESAEYAARSGPSVLVSLLYTAMMQRTPDTAGFSFWVNRIASGAANERTLIDQFYASVEYHDRFLNIYSMPATPASIDASRFLTQATFGPKSLIEIARLQKKGYAAWIDEQMSLPLGSQVGYLNDALVRHNTGYVYDEDTYEAVWQQWLFGEDQLRARMVFALSQIFVISNVAPDLDPWAMSSYWDMLNRNAFGNYRVLLEEVTLHPAMGYYLNMLQSQKEDPATGRHPNENYAREVLQLFSIGLAKLNIDGTQVVDGNGKAIPTYGEDTVGGFARAFSGWSFAGANTADSKTFMNAKANWTAPMQAWPSQHSTSSKTLLDGTVLPPFQTAERDMKDALDNIFYNPNVGPFICRELIQRFITSNPSRAAIQRCASTFNNDGAGARGNLAAVLKAILLDPEARDTTLIAGAAVGKQKEPVIRFAAFLRAFGARSTSGRNAIHYLDSPDDGLAQSPLLAPSVFNFFSPNFRPTGPAAPLGLVAPEFQITTETSVVGTINFFTGLTDRGNWGSGDTRLNLDYALLQGIALDPPKLAEHLNMLFMAGSMSAGLKDTLVRAVTAMPTSNTRNRVEAALMIMSAAPEFVIQK